jgi:hypothetical protein
MKKFLALSAWVALLGGLGNRSLAQSLGNAGTIEGTVVDQTGAGVPNAKVTLRNALTGYMQTISTGSEGSFRLVNIPPNPYRLEVTASGFSVSSQDVEIRNSIPVQVKATLALAGGQTTVTVEGAAEALETDPSAHIDVDSSQMLKIPAFDPGASLSQVVTYSTGGLRRTETDSSILWAIMRKPPS